jgi:signal transduction histidine kinase
MRAKFNAAISLAFVALTLPLRSGEPSTQSSASLDWAKDSDAIVQSAPSYPHKALELVEARLKASENLEPRAQIAYLNALSRVQYQLVALDASREAANRALELAIKYHDPVGEAGAYFNLMVAEFVDGRVESAAALGAKCLALREKQNDPRHRSETLAFLGYLYYRTSNFDRAVETLTQAMELSRAAGDRRGVALARNDLGRVLAALNRDAEAQAIFRDVIDEAHAVGDLTLEAQADGNLAMSLERVDPVGAERYHREGLRLRRLVDTPRTAFALYVLADNLIRQKKFPEAVKLTEEAVEILEQTGVKSYLPHAYAARGVARRGNGDLAGGRADLELAYAGALEVKDKATERDTAEPLMDAYAADGDYHHAYDVSRFIADLDRDAAQEKITLRVAELERRYESERQQREIDRLNRRNEQQAAELAQRRLRQQLLTAVLIGAIAAAALTGAFFLRLRGTHRRLDAAHQQLQLTQQQLIATSRLAGMAEVATGVLHNIGNVLNSVNVSAQRALQHVRNSRGTGLGKVAQLLASQADHLGDFVTNDPRGRQLPAYIQSLANHLNAEREEQVAELRSLLQHITHMNEAVQAQQNHARIAGVIEAVPPVELVENALHLCADSLQRHQVEIIRDFRDAPAVCVERQKVVQVLVNLIRNAQDSVQDGQASAGQLRITVRPGRDGFVAIEIADNGGGIAPENLPRLFTFGFSTKKTGHGFGLHSGALTAREIGGSLAAHSDGLGCGATFVFELPVGDHAVAEVVANGHAA